MPAYFADTWFFVALFDRRDAHHARARRLALATARSKVVTHDAVLTEVLAHFSDDGPGSRMVAVQGVRRAVLAHEVIPATRDLFIAGLDMYARRLDKEYSHVDCMSMVLMEQRGIRHVLTNDHHFTQAGFTIVNE
jgi:predicted nucleic acid-binding protein